MNDGCRGGLALFLRRNARGTRVIEVEEAQILDKTKQLRAALKLPLVQRQQLEGEQVAFGASHPVPTSEDLNVAGRMPRPGSGNVRPLPPFTRSRLRVAYANPSQAVRVVESPVPALCGGIAASSARSRWISMGLSRQGMPVLARKVRD